jgi:hypothetical protein
VIEALSVTRKVAAEQSDEALQQYVLNSSENKAVTGPLIRCDKRHNAMQCALSSHIISYSTVSYRIVSDST